MEVTLCLTCVKTCDEVPYCAIDQTTLVLGDNKLYVDDYISCALPSRIAHKILFSIKKEFGYCTTSSKTIQFEPLHCSQNEHYFFMCSNNCVANSKQREQVLNHLSSSSSSSPSEFSSLLQHSSSSLLCQQKAFNKAMLIDVFREVVQCKSVQNVNGRNYRNETKREMLSSPSLSLSCVSTHASPLAEEYESSKFFDEILLCSTSIDDNAIGSGTGIRCEHLTDFENIKQISNVLDDMEWIDMAILINRRYHRSVTFHFCSKLSVMQLGTMIVSHEPCHVYLLVSSEQSAEEVQELVEQWQGVKSLVSFASCGNKIKRNEELSALSSQVHVGKPITSFEEGNTETIKALEQEVIRLRNQIQSMQNKSTFLIGEQREISTDAHSKDTKSYRNAKHDIVDSGILAQENSSTKQLLYANKEIARLSKEKEEMARTIELQSHIIVEAKKALLSLSENETNEVSSINCTPASNKSSDTLSLEAIRKSTEKQRQPL